VGACRVGRLPSLLLGLGLLAFARGPLAAAGDVPQAEAPAEQRADPQAAERRLTKGVELFRAGDTLGAIDSWEDALRLDPRRLDARANLGAAYARLGRYEEAIGHYRAVLEAEPEQDLVRFNLGLALYKAARVSDASLEFARVLDKPGVPPSAALLLADCKLQMGRDAEVVALLSAREAQLGSERLFAFLLGTALIRQGELARGQRLVDTVLGPESAEAHFLLGVARFQRQEYQEALAELSEAIRLDPELPSARSALGLAQLDLHLFEEAARSFEAERARNPNDFDASLQLALLALRDDRLDDARDLLRRAALLRPGDPSVLYSSGRLHLATRELETARADLEALVAAAPAYIHGHALLARVYSQLKLPERAAAELAIVETLREADATRGVRTPEDAAASPAKPDPAPAVPGAPPPAPDPRP
jgi:tetratricopeptide (TPR) repeat protein